LTTDEASFVLKSCPDTAPAWFRSLYERLGDANLGHQYVALVNAWVRIEQASLFEDGLEDGGYNVQTELMPAMVGKWIRGKVKGRLVGSKLEEFAAEWRAWWDSLQPSWRRRGLDGAWSIDVSYGGAGTQWGSLYAWGENGVVALVAGVYIWGRNAPAESVSWQEWEAAVADLGWMLEGMAAFYERFGWGKRR
jgi:hypothetical protein